MCKSLIINNYAESVHTALRMLYTRRNEKVMTKIIHYCWFGSPVPDTVKRNVENWSRLNPDFEIREWNDENFSLPDIAYARRALQTSRYAHYSDVARLVILLQYGGWYLDSDVELLRPLSIWNCYCNHLILGYIYDCALGTAVTYSPRDNVYLLMRQLILHV